jgi:hypothetical protein
MRVPLATIHLQCTIERPAMSLSRRRALLVTKHQGCGCRQTRRHYVGVSYTSQGGNDLRLESQPCRHGGIVLEYSYILIPTISKTAIVLSVSKITDIGVKLL